jgi:hypothetical protein
LVLDGVTDQVLARIVDPVAKTVHADQAWLLMTVRGNGRCKFVAAVGASMMKGLREMIPAQPPTFHRISPTTNVSQQLWRVVMLNAVKRLCLTVARDSSLRSEWQQSGSLWRTSARLKDGIEKSSLNCRLIFAPTDSAAMCAPLSFRGKNTGVLSELLDGEFTPVAPEVVESL